jgi:hypothetical protein
MRQCSSSKEWNDEEVRTKKEELRSEVLVALPGDMSNDAWLFRQLATVPNSLAGELERSLSKIAGRKLGHGLGDLQPARRRTQF